MAGTGYVIIKESVFNDTMKFIVEKQATARPLYKELEDVKRTIDAMDIDALVDVMTGSIVDMCKDIKLIAEDGKVNLADTGAFIKLGSEIIGAFKKLGSLKEEVKSFTLIEILYVGVAGFMAYEQIAEVENAKMAGPLQN